MTVSGLSFPWSLDFPQDFPDKHRNGAELARRGPPPPPGPLGEYRAGTLVDDPARPGMAAPTGDRQPVPARRRAHRPPLADPTGPPPRKPLPPVPHHRASGTSALASLTRTGRHTFGRGPPTGHPRPVVRRPDQVGGRLSAEDGSSSPSGHRKPVHEALPRSGAAVPPAPARRGSPPARWSAVDGAGPRPVAVLAAEAVYWPRRTASRAGSKGERYGWHPLATARRRYARRGTPVRAGSSTSGAPRRSAAPARTETARRRTRPSPGRAAMKPGPAAPRSAPAAPGRPTRARTPDLKCRDRWTVRVHRTLRGGPGRTRPPPHRRRWPTRVRRPGRTRAGARPARARSHGGQPPPRASTDVGRAPVGRPSGAGRRLPRAGAARVQRHPNRVRARPWARGPAQPFDSGKRRLAAARGGRAAEGCVRAVPVDTGHGRGGAKTGLTQAGRSPPAA